VKQIDSKLFYYIDWERQDTLRGKEGTLDYYMHCVSFSLTLSLLI